jgi:hypothetical protein
MTDDSLLREVDEAVRHDRLMNIWNQLKLPLIYAASALILVTAGSSIWRNYQEKQAEEITLAFEDAQALYAAKQYEKASESFEDITHRTRGNLADMAKLWRARALLGANKKKSATRVLQNIIIAPEGHDLFWRDMACLYLIGATSHIKEMPETCNGTTASPLSPILTQFAAAGKWSDGDTVAAAKLLSDMAKNPETTKAAREQAEAWATTIRMHQRKE